MNILFVYKKNKEFKVLDFNDKSSEIHKQLIKNSWTHVATVDAIIIVKEFYKLTT